jgi:hypothetical protein
VKVYTQSYLCARNAQMVVVVRYYGRQQFPQTHAMHAMRERRAGVSLWEGRVLQAAAK